MNNLRAAAQQALEALEQSETTVPYEGFGMARREAERKHQAAITALRAALAESVEPVAYIHRQGNHFEVSERHLDEDEKARGWTEEPLYTAPPQRPAEPVQEPVAWRFEARHIDSAWAAAVTLKHPGPEGVYMRNVMPLYTAPPQRKPLTEEEIKRLVSNDMVQFARAIEREHGIT